MPGTQRRHHVRPTLDMPLALVPKRKFLSNIYKVEILSVLDLLQVVVYMCIRTVKSHTRSSCFFFNNLLCFQNLKLNNLIFISSKWEDLSHYTQPNTWCWFKSPYTALKGSAKRFVTQPPVPISALEQRMSID